MDNSNSMSEDNLVIRRSRRRFFFGVASLLLGLLFLYFAYYNYSLDEHGAVWVMIAIVGVFALFFWKFIVRDAAIVEIEIDGRGITSNQYGYIPWNNVFAMLYLKPNNSSRFVPYITLCLIKPVGMKRLLGRVFNMKSRRLEIKMADVNVEPSEIYAYAMGRLHEYRARHGRPKRTGDIQFDVILDQLDELQRKFEEAMRDGRQEDAQRLFEQAIKLLSAQTKRLK